MNRRFFSKLLTVLGLLVFAWPTSGLAAEVANHLVISEVQLGSRTNPANSFVELYNPTDTDLSLAGWSLQYKGDDRLSPVVVLKAFSPSSVVPHHGYFLVARTGSALPVSPDETFEGTDLSLRSGTVLLVRATGAVSDQTDSPIVDRVGYGSSDWPENSPAPAPVLDTSIERLPNHDYSEGNGIDTGMNAADFVVRQNSDPQNTQSAREIPAPPVVSEMTPSPGAYLATMSPTISAKVTDTGSGVNAASLELKLNGVKVNHTFAADTVSFSLSEPLRQGTHTVSLSASDNASFSTTQAWSFTVDTIAPTVSLQIAKFAPVTNTLETTVVLTASDEPAGQASGVSEMQLAFDGMIDTEPWEPFSQEVTRNLMNKEGLQAVVVRVRDRAGNVSSQASATTTVLLSSDITPIAAPAGPSSHTVNKPLENIITIRWPAVAGAVSYMVRYSDGQTLFGPVKTTDTTVTIGGLDPAKTYQFEVASVSATGSVSSFSKVLPVFPTGVVVAAAGPTKPAPATALAPSPSEASLPAPVGGPELAIGPDGQEVTSTITQLSSPTPPPAGGTSPSPSPAIKAEEDAQPRDWTRVIVALSILIIAAGVATGGWYLYQWWNTRPSGPGKGKGKSGRW